MKHRLIILLSLISCLLQSTFAEKISYSDALNIVVNDFAWRDVDIYQLDADLLSIKWTFFVDAYPMQGWEHECHVYQIMKNPLSTESISDYLQVTTLSMPPEGTLTPAIVKNRYGLNVDHKPHVRIGSPSYDEMYAAVNTFAFIINTGGYRNANYERYWNDCSFIYQTLRNKYQIPKNNIYVAMADGTNPATDMLGLDHTYKSSPVDLDFDGEPDISCGATELEIGATIDLLTRRAHSLSHVFIYIVGPGGCYGPNSNAYLTLWGNRKLHDTQLVELIRPLTEKTNVSIVLGHGCSGIFANKLRSLDCIITAANNSMLTWSCRDIPFNEFVYKWTCAVNEANYLSTPLLSDEDGNGKVTMKEAFTFASRYNIPVVTISTPYYYAKNWCLGEDLAFNNIPKPVDLYIKDNPNDTGKEPNLTSDVFWYSPDMWVRNKHDWGTEHQNPECVDFGSSCVVYTRVRNRGRETYTGGKWLHLYWSKASTAITNQAWVGNELYNNTIVTGEHLRPAAIPGPIPPGCDTIVPISWALPLDMVGTEDDNWTEKHHFCLLGKIEDSNTAIMDIKDVRTVDITGQNDVAQLNVSIISHKEAMAGTAVFVRNVMKGEKEYSLEVRPKVAADAAIFTDANVDLWLSRKIYSGWSKGGLRSNNVRTYHSGDSARVRLLSKESRLESVFMNDSEFDKVTMKLNFVNIPVTQKTYTFDLIQRDGDGNIVGGETFIVKSPEVSTNSMQIETESTGNGNYELTAEISGGDYEKIWYDADGLEIGRGDNITVKPTREANEYSVTALSANGEMARESVTLTPELGIKTITPAASVGDNLGVTLYNEAPANSAVCVSSVNTGTTMVTESVGTGETTVEVDTSSLPTGLYVVTYTEDGNIVDSKRFDKK